MFQTGHFFHIHHNRSFVVQVTNLKYFAYRFSFTKQILTIKLPSLQKVFMANLGSNNGYSYDHVTLNKADMTPTQKFDGRLECFYSLQNKPA